MISQTNVEGKAVIYRHASRTIGLRVVDVTELLYWSMEDFHAQLNSDCATKPIQARVAVRVASCAESG